MGALTEVEIAARLDPEIADGLVGTLPEHLPGGELTVDQVRRVDRELAVMPEAHGSSELVPRSDGSQLELRRYVPAAPDATISRTVILWIHGGGMFLGSARQDDARAQELCDALGVRIASVDYRLAPEHPYPEPLDDCYTALAWLSERFDRVIVVGASAGGGLAAGLALLARDRSGPAIAGIQLIYPMLDDRQTDGARSLAQTVVWNAPLNRLGWDSYLGAHRADAYAVPARAVDLSGLPPTYVEVGDLDLFFEEDTTFAAALGAAGVHVDFFIEEGAPHGFDLIAPDAAISRAAGVRRAEWLANILHSETSNTTGLAS